MKKTFLIKYAFYIILGMNIPFVSMYASIDLQSGSELLVNNDDQAERRAQEKEAKIEQKALERKKQQEEREALLRQREQERLNKLEQKALERDKAQELKQKQLEQRQEELLEKARQKKLEREKADDDREKQLKLAEEQKKQKIEQQKAREEQARLDREENLRRREQEKEQKLQQKEAARQKAKAFKEEQLKIREQMRIEKEIATNREQDQEPLDDQIQILAKKEQALKETIQKQKAAQKEQGRLEREQKLRAREQQKQDQLEQKEAERTKALALKQEQARAREQAYREKNRLKNIELEKKKANYKEQLQADKERKDAALIEQALKRQKAQQEKQRLKALERKNIEADIKAQLKLSEEKKEQDRLERDKNLRKQEQEKQAKLQQKDAERKKMLALKQEQALSRQQAQQEKARLRAIELEKAKLAPEADIQQRENEKQAELARASAEREKAQALKKDAQQAKIQTSISNNIDKKTLTGRDYYDALINELNGKDIPRKEMGENILSSEEIEPTVSEPQKIRSSKKERSNVYQEKRQSMLRQQARDYTAQTVQEVDGFNASNQEVKRLLIGRDYYYALVDVSTQRRWALPITCNFSLTNGAFDNNGQHTSLSNSIMGGPVTLEDIYLFARLGDENLVGNQSSFQPATKSPAVGQSGNLPFGAYANDLYTTLLAPMQIGFGLQQSEACIDFTAMYRFDIAACGKVIGFAGATLPVKTAIVDADLQLQQGILYVESFAAGQNVVRERTLTQFFGDYESVEDFFIRAVLGSKGIGFANRQVKVGMGDFSLFGIIDIGGLWEYADGIQFGLTIVFPTGSAGNPNMLFNPSLSDGSYKFEPFFNAIFNSPSPVFNPAVKLVGSFSASRSTGSSGGTRVGQTLSSSGRVQVKTVPGLSFPARFADYYVSAFDASSSSIPMFGDAAVPAIIKSGNKFLLGIGNYFFNVFNLGFRLGVFYDYIRKGSDSVCIDKCQGAFDTSGLTANTSQRSHSIGFNLTYKFKNMLELNFGTENVIGGRNVPRTNDFFVSMIAVF
jgi:hypothetical protein